MFGYLFEPWFSGPAHCSPQWATCTTTTLVPPCKYQVSSPVCCWWCCLMPWQVVWPALAVVNAHHSLLFPPLHYHNPFSLQPPPPCCSLHHAPRNTYLMLPSVAHHGCPPNWQCLVCLLLPCGVVFLPYYIGIWLGTTNVMVYAQLQGWNTCADHVIVLLTMSLHSWLWRGMRWGSIWTAYYTQSEEVVRVPAIHNELRGLIVVRNEMVWYMRNRNSLSQWRNIKAQGKNHDIECGPAAEPFLPPTIDDEQSYKWRYALDICMLYWKVFPYDHTFPLRHWLNWITILFIYRLLKKFPTPALLLRRPMNSKLHI